MKRFNNLEGLSKDERHLTECAHQAMENAYAPYSKFRVGVALLLSDGTIVKGNNQENIAYPSGLCAERVALFTAGANHSDTKIEVMVIVSDGELLKMSEIISPCGACRQVMLESENRQSSPIRIVLIGRNQEVIVFYSASDLLPMFFG